VRQKLKTLPDPSFPDGIQPGCVFPTLEYGSAGGLPAKQLETIAMKKIMTRAMAILWVTMTALGSIVAQETVKPVASASASPASPLSAPTASEDSSSTSGANTQFQQRYPRYRIEAGDQFDVNFDLSPEFNQTVTVQPDGYVTMRGVGDLHVQGQTVPELMDTLRKAYGKILNSPIISVVLKDFEKPYFIADGQVGKPGKYDMRGDITLTQAIAIAGGFTDAAKHSQVLLYRKVNDQWMEGKLINVKEMENSHSLKEDPLLHPGDMLFVPKNRLSKYKQFIPSANAGAYIR
jgi:polysaccharide biosynthesis/export protein